MFQYMKLEFRGSKQILESAEGSRNFSDLNLNTAFIVFRASVERQCSNAVIVFVTGNIRIMIKDFENKFLK